MKELFYFETVFYIINLHYRRNFNITDYLISELNEWINTLHWRVLFHRTFSSSQLARLTTTAAIEFKNKENGMWLRPHDRNEQSLYPFRSRSGFTDFTRTSGCGCNKQVADHTFKANQLQVSLRTNKE